MLRWVKRIDVNMTKLNWMWSWRALFSCPCREECKNRQTVWMEKSEGGFWPTSCSNLKCDKHCFLIHGLTFRRAVLPINPIQLELWVSSTFDGQTNYFLPWCTFFLNLYLIFRSGRIGQKQITFKYQETGLGGFLHLFYRASMQGWGASCIDKQVGVQCWMRCPYSSHIYLRVREIIWQ